MRIHFVVLILLIFVSYTAKSSTWIDPTFKEGIQKAEIIGVAKFIKEKNDQHIIEFSEIYKGKLDGNRISYRVPHSHNHGNDELKTDKPYLFILFKDEKGYYQATQSFGIYYIDDSITYVPIKDPLSRIVLEKEIVIDYIKYVTGSSKNLETRLPAAYEYLKNTNLNTKIESDVYNQVKFLEIIALCGKPGTPNKIYKFLRSPFYHVSWAALNALRKDNSNTSIDTITKFYPSANNNILKSVAAKTLFFIPGKVDKDFLYTNIPTSSSEPCHLASSIMNPIFNTLPSPRNALAAILMKQEGSTGNFEELCKKAQPFIINHKKIVIDPLEYAKDFYSLEDALKVPLEVLTLRLTSDSLKTFPMNILKLVNLQSLSFNKNQLSSIPDRVSQLKSLRILDLSENSFEKLPKSISGLKNLESLNLGENKQITFSDDDFLAYSELKELTLNEIPITKLPSSIFGLPKLEKLNISQTELSTLPPEIKKLKTLTSINARMADLESLPDVFAEMPTMEHMELYGNDFYNFPEQLLKSNSIKSLELGSNDIASIPDELGKMKSLKYLDVSYNNFSEREKALIRNKFDGIFINTEGYKDYHYSYEDALLDPQSVTIIYMRDDSLSQRDYNIGQFKNLKTLVLMHNNLKTIPSWVNTAKKLRTLRLDNNQLSDIPDKLGKLKSVETLYLANNPISAIPEDVKKMSSLKELYLFDCKLQDVPNWLFDMKSIETLSLSDNNIPETRKRELRNLAKKNNITIWLD